MAPCSGVLVTFRCWRVTNRWQHGSPVEIWLQALFASPGTMPSASHLQLCPHAQQLQWLPVVWWSNLSLHTLLVAFLCPLQSWAKLYFCLPLFNLGWDFSGFWGPAGRSSHRPRAWPHFRSYGGWDEQRAKRCLGSAGGNPQHWAQEYLEASGRAPVLPSLRSLFPNLRSCWSQPLQGPGILSHKPLSGWFWVPDQDCTLRPCLFLDITHPNSPLPAEWLSGLCFPESAGLRKHSLVTVPATDSTSQQEES